MMLCLDDNLSGSLNNVLEEQKDFEDFARLIYLLSVYYMFEYVLNED